MISADLSTAWHGQESTVLSVVSSEAIKVGAGFGHSSC